jgi:hypothetical protein
MTDKEVEEIKAELHRIEKKRQDQTDTIKAWAIAAIIIALLAFLYWRGSRVPNSISNDPNLNPYSATCEQYGNC